jgi:hypothetical protein
MAPGPPARRARAAASIVTELKIIRRPPAPVFRVPSNGMGRGGSRRHPTTIALIAAAFAALLLLSQARLVADRPPVAAVAGVVAHPVTGHALGVVALRAVRSRGAHPRFGHPSAIAAAAGLVVVLFALAGLVRPRAAMPAGASRAAGARGPPHPAG